MKRIILAAAGFSLLSFSAAYAAAPAVVVKAVEDCCSLALACCDAVAGCC